MPDQETPARVDVAAVDAVIAKIDEQVERALDAILHHPTFQRFERLWRGLHFVVERARFDRGVRVELLNCSKADLRAACHAWPEGPGADTARRSALYRAIASTNPERVAPVGVIVGDYEFDSGDTDVSLLGRIAEVAQGCQAPFLTAAGASFFGLESYQALAGLGDLYELLGAADRYDAFRKLRRHDSARYLALVLPRFELRAPHRGHDIAGDCSYTERVESHEHRCWGNAALALASCIAGSFAEYGWGANIAGADGGGRVFIDAPAAASSATEIALSPLQRFGLNGRGLVGLSGPLGEPPRFDEVPSVAQPRFYGRNPAGEAENFNDFLVCHLPYLLIATRLAHQLLLFHHREGGASDPGTLAERAQSWLMRYVHDTGVPTAASRAVAPFRSAKLEVEALHTGVRWRLRASPLFPYQGEVEPFLEGIRFFTVSVGGTFR